MYCLVAGSMRDAEATPEGAQEPSALAWALARCPGCITLQRVLILGMLD